MSLPPATADLRIRATKPLLAPAILEEEIPLDAARAALVARTRREVGAIVTGADDRLLVVVGPCSVHDPVATLDYADRLAALAPAYAAELLLVMRVYFEKPRTVVGWKGLINDPDRDASYQINKGLRLARRLLSDVTGRGLPDPKGDPGNLYALVLVKVPAELTEAEREAYEQLARVSTFDPRAAR